MQIRDDYIYIPISIRMTPTANPLATDVWIHSVVRVLRNNTEFEQSTVVPIGGIAVGSFPSPEEVSRTSLERVNLS